LCVFHYGFVGIFKKDCIVFLFYAVCEKPVSGINVYVTTGRI
jgi:hypothetical protein